MKKTVSDDFRDIYEINLSTGVIHYKKSHEIELVDYDTGESFLLTDYEEAKEVCELILSLIRIEK